MKTLLTDILSSSHQEIVIEALSLLRNEKLKAYALTRTCPSTERFTRRDFGIDAIDAILVRLDIDVAELPQDVLADPVPVLPRVGLRMEGGAIQSVFSSVPVQMDILNYDLEDGPPGGFEDEAHLLIAFPQARGEPSECILSRYEADVMPLEFRKIDEALSHAVEKLPTPRAP